MDSLEIARQAVNPAIVTDQRSRILGWNRAAGDLFGLRKNRTVGNRLHDLLKVTDAMGNPLGSKHCALREILHRAEAGQGLRARSQTAFGARVRMAVSVIAVLGHKPSGYRLVYLLNPARWRPASTGEGKVGSRAGPEKTHAGQQPGETHSATLHLTRRQIEVLRFIARGRSAGEIARALGVSIHTIRSHIRNIFKSLGVRSQLQAASMALRDGLLDAEADFGGK